MFRMTLTTGEPVHAPCTKKASTDFGNMVCHPEVERTSSLYFRGCCAFSIVLRSAGRNEQVHAGLDDLSLTFALHHFAQPGWHMFTVEDA